MTTSEACQDLIKNLVPLYEPAEAASIAAIVLEDAFGVKRSQIFDNQEFTGEQLTRLAEILAHLLTCEPVQYVLGETQFFGLTFKVNTNVLIPRQETEELVAWVIETVKSRQSAVGSLQSGDTSPFRVLDIGTGSGCIPVSIKKRMPELEVHAVDVSEAALATAKENADLNDTEIQFHFFDILEEKNWNKPPDFDLIVSNPPYITESEKKHMPHNVLDFEPHLALFTTDGDPQQFVKKITAFAKQKLRPGGWLLFETNEFHAPDSQRIMEENGFVDVELRKDLNGKDRMLRGRFF